ncbi:hypothetical protein ACF0H5_009867 [Mactra antiquata]
MFDIKISYLVCLVVHVLCVEGIPSWCYQPPGSDCTWYKQCLAKRFPCEANNDSYAVSFGDKICNDFTKQRSLFSDVGQQWIDTTRACLQKQLASILSAPTSTSCDDIRTFAFNTHAQCYNNPPIGCPSFCELLFSDWLRIAWIVKSSFVLETVRTSYQVTEILGLCIRKLYLQFFLFD